MRVLWIVGLVPNKVGGFERVCVRLAQRNRVDGVDTHFVFEAPPCTALATQLAAHGAAWHVVPQVGVLGWREDLALWRLLRRIRPDVVHLHFCAFLCVFFLLASMLRAPLFATYHYSGAPTPAQGWRRLVKRLRLSLFSGSIRGMTAVSCAARDKLVVDYLLPRERVSVIYNGTDLAGGVAPAPAGVTSLSAVAAAPASPGVDGAAASALAPPPAQASGPTVAFVGALIPEKGAAVAIRALAASLDLLPAARLTVVGEGPELASLQRLAAALGLRERIAFLGLRSDVAQILTQQDMLVVPSIWAEAFGFVVIEAMAVGCAVIASEIGGIPEIVTDNEDGLLVPAGDCAALGQAIGRLWSDAPLRRRLVSKARETIEARFTLTQCVDQYRELYARLAGAAATR